MTETMKLVLLISLWPLEMISGFVAGIWLLVLWNKGRCAQLEWWLQLSELKKEVRQRRLKPLR